MILKELFSLIAEAIRNIKGTAEKIPAESFPEEINNIGEQLDIIPSTEAQNYTGIYKEVKVAGDSNLISENIRKGVTIFGVEGSYDRPEYTELLYIEGTGTQNIDTGIIPTNHKLEIKFKYTSTVDNKTIFSSDPVAYSLQWFSNAWCYGFGNVVDYYSGTGHTELQTVIFNNDNNKIEANGVEYASLGEVSNATSNLFIFKRPDGATGNCYARVYYLKLYDKSTGKLVRDMIPVKNLEGVICMYDKVSETYFYNQGTGSFLGGI